MMTTKEYLGQACRLDQFIDMKLRQAQSYRDLATKTTSAIVDTPRSGSPDLQPIAEFVAKIVDAEAEINDMVDRLIDLKREIARFIADVEDLDQRLLLERRYLCFQTWEEIAVCMHFSVRWVHVVHSRALGAVDKLMRERSADS